MGERGRKKVNNKRYCDTKTEVKKKNTRKRRQRKPKKSQKK